MKKYQVIFKFGDDSRVIFVGTTNSGISELVSDCIDALNGVFSELEQVIYEPFSTPNRDEQKKEP